MDSDIGAAFNRLDRLLEVAQEAGPSIALLMEAGRQQGLGDQTVQKHLKLNTTVLRWCLKLSADATADRDELELIDAGALLIEWARR